MALYTRESRDQVRDAVDFVALVSARTELRRAGPSRYEGLCPFHDERTPSFGIDPDQKVYYCFGCQAAGDVFTFVQETEGVDFAGALELLADRCGVELEREREDPRQAEHRRHRERLLALLARASAYYERCLWQSSEAAGARAQLARRGLGEEILREFGVGYAPSAWNRMLKASSAGGFSAKELFATGLVQRSRQSGRLYDRFRSRVMFPLSDIRGRVLGFGARATGEQQGPKYLNSADNDVYHKGRHLYGAHLARAHAAHAGQVIVCEGYTDVIALHQAQMRNAVGLMGTALTAEQMAELARMAQTVLLALDADAAGQEAMLRVAAIAARRRLELRVVALPDGADPAELLQRDGPQAMAEAVAAAVSFERFRVERILAEGDHSSPEGKDRMIAALRPVFAELAPSAHRMELTRLVSSRLALQESLVESLIAEGPSRRADGGEPERQGRSPAPGQRRHQAGAAGASLSRGEQTERTFLALCLACPQQGEPALAQVDVDTHFTSDLLRRAARHLRGHLREPLHDLDSDGGGEGAQALEALLAELLVQAGREPAQKAMLQVQRLQLELARIDREIQAARLPAEREASSDVADDAMAGDARAHACAGMASGRPQSAPAGAEMGMISGLAARRAQVMREFDQAYELALEQSAS